MSKRYSGKSFKDSSIKKKPKQTNEIKIVANDIIIIKDDRFIPIKAS